MQTVSSKLTWSRYVELLKIDDLLEKEKIMKNEIILFETEDQSITLPVQVTSDTVWLNRNQLAELFGRDIKTIGKHIGNALKEELKESEVVAKFATTT